MAAVNPRNLEAEEAADPSVQDRGDEDLGKARVAMIALWLSTSRYLRRYLSQFFFELLPFLQDDHRYLQDDTGLLSGSRKMLTGKVQRELGPILDTMDVQFRARIRRMVERAARAQFRHLALRGVKGPTDEVLTRVIDDAVLGLDREFPPGSGVTYMDRIRRINVEHQRTLTTILNRTYSEEAREKVIYDIRTSLTYTRPGRTPVPGGSASKKAMGLFTAEQARLVNEVEMAVIRESGVRLAYWRLSPTHPWYGGSEICEVLASVQDPEVSRYLSKTPGGSGVGLEGLHFVSEWPHYPHPYCRCFPEPVIL
jgi:hypothetical protein